MSRSDLPFVWTSAIVFTALLAFAVLAFGGTEPWAMGIVETGIVLIAGTWGLRMAIAPYTLATDISQWPLALAVVWCAAQFVFGGTVYAFSTAQTTLQWCTCFLIFSDDTGLTAKAASTLVDEDSASLESGFERFPP